MITIINFSNRQSGNCGNIAKMLQNNLKDSKIYNFGELNDKTCGKCDYQCLKTDKKCIHIDQINELYESIVKSKCTYFIVPNYCDFPCANFFIFNERSCGYFAQDENKLNAYLSAKKKFIVVSNSNEENFKKAFSYQVNDEKDLDILFLSAKKFKLNSLDGNLMDNENAVNLIVNFSKDEYKLETSAMAIVLFENKILATCENIYGTYRWSLPKGHLETGEKPIDTAIRECFEETGILIDKKHLIKELTPYTYNFIDHHLELVKKTIVPIVFRVNEALTPNIKEEGIKEALFIDFYKFLNICSYNNVKELLSDIDI